MGSITTSPGTIPTSVTLGVPFSYQFSAGTYTAVGPTTTPSYTASWTTEYEDPSYTITSYHETVWGDGNEVYIGYNGFATFTIQPAFQYTADQLKSINGVITIEWGDSLNVTSTNAYFTLPDISGSTQYSLRQGSVTNMTFTFSAGGTRIVKPTIVFYAGDLADQGGVIWGFNNIVFTIATPIVPGVSTTYQSIFSPPVSVPTNYFLAYQTFANNYTLVVASTSGPRSLPTPNPVSLTLTTTKTDGVTVLSTRTFLFTVGIPYVSVTPTLTGIIYPNQPFSFTFYTASTVNVPLSATPGSDLISLYGTSGTSLLFSSEGYATAGSYNLSVDTYVDLTKVNTTVFPFVILPTPTISTTGLTNALYKYEPFSMTFSLQSPTTLTLQYNNSSSTLQTLFSRTSSTSLVLAGTFQTASTTPYALIVNAIDSGGNIYDTISLSVTVGNGRFFPPAPGQNYQLYQYEAISNTLGSNPVFYSALSIDNIFSIPSLPIGVSFSNVNSNTYCLRGTPTLASPQSNFQIFGSNSTNGKIISTTVSVKVNGQVVRIAPTSVTAPNLVVGNPITPISFTSALPTTIYAFSFQYAWDPLPDGLVFKDVNSNVVGQGFAPTDSNLTIILSGTPTSTGAALLATSPSYQVRLVGLRTDQTGTQIRGYSVIRFSFSETLIFTASVSSTLYESLPLTSTDVTVTPITYFYSGAYPTISSLVASSLPAGLSLQHVGSNYYLTGTPTTPSSASYKITSINTNGTQGTLQLTIPINADTPTFLSPTPDSGTPITLIVSRPMSFDYPDVVFSATSPLTSVAHPITYSSSLNFASYGLTVYSGTTYRISGTPTVSLAGQVVTITATDYIGKTATTTIYFTINQDSFTWPDYTPTYYQNRLITPYQMVISTASGRSIQMFSSLDSPDGLFVNPGGLISGTPTTGSSGTFTVTATTGYTTISYSYSFTMIPDNFLTVQLNDSDPFTTIFSNIYFKSILYSSDAVITPTYTVSLYPIQSPAATVSLSSSGNLSGNFSGVTPYSVYLADVNAVYGSFNITTPSQLCFTFSNVASPLLIAAYIENGTGLSKVRNTSSYVFRSVTDGTKLSNAQSWTDSGVDASTDTYYGNGGSDISAIGSNFVASSTTVLYSGTYNYTTNSFTWPSSLIYNVGLQITCVGNDGINKWISFSPSYPGYFNVYTKTTTGSWSSGYATVNVSTTAPTCIQYMSPYFVGANGTYIMRASTPFTSWTATNVGFNVTKIIAVGTTLIAVGRGISTSTNAGGTWTSQNFTTPSIIYSGTIKDIAYVNGTWVICGIDSTLTNSFIAYGPSLTEWTLYTPPITDTWSALNFNGNAWTFAGSSSLLYLDAGPWPTQTTVVTSSSGIVNKLISGLFSNGPAVPKTVFIPRNSVLSYTTPTQSGFMLYQYVPYSFTFGAVPTTDFIYYYSDNIPIGFQFLLDSAGTIATLTGISPVVGTQTVSVYAKTATSTSLRFTVSLQTVLPFFVNPQSGASAYTAILRNEVEANAAQNARDNKTFPQVDSLAGPFMGPRAPDVVTARNCLLKLCKKPCPTCHSM